MTTTAIQDFGQCPWCGMIHQGECSRVKAKEFYPDGTLKRIEFHDPNNVLGQSTDCTGKGCPDTRQSIDLTVHRDPPEPAALTTDDYNWLFGTGRFAQ